MGPTSCAGAVNFIWESGENWVGALWVSTEFGSSNLKAEQPNGKNKKRLRIIFSLILLFTASSFHSLQWFELSYSF